MSRAWTACHCLPGLSTFVEARMRIGSARSDLLDFRIPFPTTVSHTLRSLHSTNRSYATRRKPQRSTTTLPSQDLASTGEQNGQTAKVDSSSTEKSSLGNKADHARRGFDLRKISTVPFHRTPASALQECTVMAHAALGYRHSIPLLISRIFARFVGEKYSFATGVKRTSFQALLVPVWNVDLSVRGIATRFDDRYQLQFVLEQGVLPGHNVAPLDKLAIMNRQVEDRAEDWDSKFVPFTSSEHRGPNVIVIDPETGQRVTGKEVWDVPLKIIPFTHHPMNALAKIAGLPKITEGRHVIALDPTKLDPISLTAHALYIPIYIAQFTRGQDEITSVVFGGTTAPMNCAVYCSFRSGAGWLPPVEFVQVLPITTSYSSLPGTPDADPKSANSLSQRLDGWLRSFSPTNVVDPPPFPLVDQIRSWEAQIVSDPRVRADLDDGKEAREYMDAKNGVEKLKEMQSEMMTFPVLDMRRVKVGMEDSDEVKRLLRQQEDIEIDKKRIAEDIAEAQRKLDIVTPEWLAEIEKDTKKRARAGRGR